MNLKGMKKGSKVQRRRGKKMIQIVGTRKMRRQRKRKMANEVHNLAQITINAALWQIIKQNADLDKPENAATLTIPKSELEGVPALFSLEVKQDEDNVFIKASVRGDKKIILLGDKQNG